MTNLLSDEAKTVITAVCKLLTDLDMNTTQNVLWHFDERSGIRDMVGGFSNCSYWQMAWAIVVTGNTLADVKKAVNSAPTKI